jgi:hypothetical protein
MQLGIEFDKHICQKNVCIHLNINGLKKTQKFLIKKIQKLEKKTTLMKGILYNKKKNQKLKATKLKQSKFVFFSIFFFFQIIALETIYYELRFLFCSSILGFLENCILEILMNIPEIEEVPRILPQKNPEKPIKS